MDTQNNFLEVIDKDRVFISEPVYSEEVPKKIVCSYGIWGESTTKQILKNREIETRLPL
jgi:hypothetical protein